MIIAVNCYIDIFMTAPHNIYVAI